MAEPQKSEKVEQQSPAQRRDTAPDRPQRRTDYSAGAHGTQNVDMPQAETPNAAAPKSDGQLGPDEISEPDEVIKNNEAKLHHAGTDTAPDHSEREMAGDQDIDTAGVVPDDKATDGRKTDGF